MQPSGEVGATRRWAWLPVLVGGVVLFEIVRRGAAGDAEPQPDPGAGFAALETMGYAFVTLIQSQGNLEAVQDILLLRGLLSPAAHMAWTGLTATALWYAASRGWKGRAVLRFLAVFALA